MWSDPPWEAAITSLCCSNEPRCSLTRKGIRFPLPSPPVNNSESSVARRGRNKPEAPTLSMTVLFDLAPQALRQKIRSNPPRSCRLRKLKRNSQTNGHSPRILARRRFVVPSCRENWSQRLVNAVIVHVQSWCRTLPVRRLTRTLVFLCVSQLSRCRVDWSLCWSSSRTFGVIQTSLAPSP